MLQLFSETNDDYLFQAENKCRPFYFLYVRLFVDFPSNNSNKYDMFTATIF